MEFNDESEEEMNIVHIRIQQRNGKKSITTIQGIDSKYDLTKVLKIFKKEFACNGSLASNDLYSQIIQLQGDKRQITSEFLIEVGLCKKEHIKIHGF